MAESLNFSQRLVMKGALIPETYTVFQAWDLSGTRASNMEALRHRNPTGSATGAWLVELSKTLSSRFANGDDIGPLVTLARNGYPVEYWQFDLLWHLGSTDGLFTAFAVDFLLSRFRQNLAITTADDVLPFVKELQKDGRITEAMTEKSLRRVSTDLLRMARAFGLLEGKVRNRFTCVSIPEDAILYALYSLMDEVPSADRAINSERWSLFLMGPDDVERELFNLHQFRRLRYEVAGTVRELSLPFSGLAEYVQSLIQ